MSKLLDRDRADVRATGLMETRDPLAAYTMVVVGALLALFGLYIVAGPTDWLWTDLGEGWYLSSWILGGALLTAGFGYEADRYHTLDGTWSPRAVTGIILAAAALIGAVTAAIVLIV